MFAQVQWCKFSASLRLLVSGIHHDCINATCVQQRLRLSSLSAKRDGMERRKGDTATNNLLTVRNFMHPIVRDRYR